MRHHTFFLSFVSFSDNGSDQLTPNRWYLTMTEPEYVKYMHELQRKSLASTDAVSKRLDDIDTKINLLIKQTTEKFQQLSNIVESGKSQRKKAKRSDSDKRKKSRTDEN